MKQQTMTVLFYLNKSKTNQKGVCPIYCRITFIKKRKQFSSGQFVSPKHWNSKTQRVSAKDVNCDFINGALLIIKQKLNNTYLKLQLQQDEFEIQDISNLYFGRNGKKTATPVSYYNKYNTKGFPLERLFADT